jgi:hypothetical protein
VPLSDDSEASVESPVDLSRLIKWRVYVVVCQITRDRPGFSVQGYYRGRVRWQGTEYLAFESEVMVHLVERDRVRNVTEVKRRYIDG